MRLSLPLVALALAACTELPDGPFPPVDDPDACGASGLQSLVGQPEAVIYATTFTVQIRILRPGEPHTDDYSAQRANFTVDRSGRITSVTCG